MDQQLMIAKLDLVEDIESAIGILYYGSLQPGEVSMITNGMLALWVSAKK